MSCSALTTNRSNTLSASSSGKIKTYEDHPDSRLRNAIQEIITRIATARTILTDPEQKQRYDEQLAEKLKVDREEIIQSRVAARLPEFELTVTSGPSQVGMHLELVTDRLITIGSSPHCSVSLYSSRMKPVHAQFEYSDDEWIIRSGKENTLILVNSHRCNELILAPGDEIDIGGYRLRFGRIGELKPKSTTLPPPVSLIVREGPSIPEPTIYVLPPNSLLLGQCETASWQLPGGQVDVHHARLETNGGLWELTDLHSQNGVFVNNEKIDNCLINHHDQVRIGNYLIQVYMRK